MEGDDLFDGEKDGRTDVLRRNRGRYGERERLAVVERLQWLMWEEWG